MNETGPFDRSSRDVGGRDRSARNLLLLMGTAGLVLLVLILPPISLLDGGGGLPAPIAANGLPETPEGLEAVSRVFRQERPREPGPYDVTVPLLQQTSDARNLAFYTHDDGKWRLLAPVTLSDGGRAATGQLDAIPNNLAVLRRTTSVAQISGWLPAGAAIAPGALEAVSTINPVAFAPAADGSLSGALPQIPSSNANIIPTVRAVDQHQVEAVNSILSSPALRDAHISALLQLAQQPGVSGIDLDYQNIHPARRGDLNLFVTTLADRLHQAGKTLTIALPTPVKAGVNWDTGAYDWQEISRRADLIKLYPEVDPSLYHERMEDVLTYLRGQIDLRKVQLVLTRASVEKGTDGLRLLSLQDALALASELEVRTSTQITPNSSVLIVGKNIYVDDGATGLNWDPRALAVAFSYPGRGGQRTVWIENGFSVAFRIDLARRYGLAGVAVDSIADDPSAPAIWQPLREYAQAGRVELVLPNSTLLKPTWQVQAGSSEVGAKGNLIWRAPVQPGGYDIAIIISDGVVRATRKIMLEVRAQPAGAPTSSGTPAPSPTARP